MTIQELLYYYSIYHPVATVVLIAINIIIFLMETVAGGSTNTNVALKFGAQYNPYIDRGQWWRLITSMFLHFGIMHLVCNMYSLYSLGSSAEYMLGSTRFLIIYFVSGLCGNLSTWYIEGRTKHYSVSAGASGAIFGLMGFYLVLAIMPQYRPYVSSLNIVSNLALNLVIGFANRRIDMKAHIGGLIGGMICSLLFIG